MDESKAIKIIKQEMGWESKSSTLRAFEEAIKALEEVQRWHTSVVNPNIKNEFANRSTQICVNCDHKDEYIEELEAEVEEYRAIGTLEECRAAVEKQTARKGIREKIKKGYNRGMHHYYCPVCYEKGDLRNKYNVGLYCSDCGQKLDWEDEE